MKKLFIVLAVASLGFVACNNDSENKGTSDTPAVTVDSPAVVPPVVDSPAAPIDSPAAMVDSPAVKK
jgi:hypothetical protein